MTQTELRLLHQLNLASHWSGYVNPDVRRVGADLGLTRQETEQAAERLIRSGFMISVGKGRIQMKPSGIETAIRAAYAGDVPDENVTENTSPLLASWTDGQLNYYLIEIDGGGIISYVVNPDTSTNRIEFEGVSLAEAQQILDDPGVLPQRPKVRGSGSGRPLEMLSMNGERLRDLGLNPPT